MAKTSLPFLTSLLIIFLISRLISTSRVKPSSPMNRFLLYSELLSLDISSKLKLDPETLAMASTDFGHLVTAPPAAVFYPSSVQDIVSLVNFSYNSPHPFKIAAWGRGHSCWGQATAKDGVVIEMSSLNKSKENDRIRVLFDENNGGFYYADVGGEQLWIDVLHATLKYGVAPASWTDYLYLTVGGTLSNAGISGQTFRYGPQISNVLELDVVTGKAEIVTCSRKINSELFCAVLGGLGQFGIIIRARIELQPVPQRVKWVRMLYDDFPTFARDQERLISTYGDEKLSIDSGLHYVEGSLIAHNNWKSSFFSRTDQAKITSLRSSNGIIYCLEVAKYYYRDSDYASIDKELQVDLRGLSYLSGFIFTKDVSFVEFLNRVRKGEIELQSKGQWDAPHPWLNIFIPRSRIDDLSHVLVNVIGKQSKSSGPILIYPLNRNKWDDMMSAVTPGENVFYAVGFPRSSTFDEWEALEDQNKEILNFCDDNGIRIKQYLPHYSNNKAEWENHFGSKWRIFQQRKALFDPKMILSPGQKIYS